jgi:hypothetical protein
MDNHPGPFGRKDLREMKVSWINRQLLSYDSLAAFPNSASWTDNTFHRSVRRARLEVQWPLVPTEMYCPGLSVGKRRWYVLLAARHYV